MSTPRVLVVDDTPELVTLVEAALRADGFAVDSVATGEAALEAVRDGAPDLIVLDVMLPGISGIEACRQLRTFSDSYVLMLTSRGDETDRVSGLEVGADDYLTKPFSPRELVARVRAMLRRPRNTSGLIGVRQFDALRIDVAARRASVGDQELDLTKVEFDLLDALTVQPNHVVTRSELLALARRGSPTSDDHVVDVHISNLRRKLNADGTSRIRTVRGVGYRFTTH